MFALKGRIRVSTGDSVDEVRSVFRQAMRKYRVAYSESPDGVIMFEATYFVGMYAVPGVGLGPKTRLWFAKEISGGVDIQYEFNYLFLPVFFGMVAVLIAMLMHFLGSVPWPALLFVFFFYAMVTILAVNSGQWFSVRFLRTIASTYPSF